MENQRGRSERARQDGPMTVANALTAPDVVAVYNNGVLIGNASVVGSKWDFKLPDVTLGPHNLTARYGALDSNLWSVERVHPPFEDLTDFNDQTLNGWLKGPAGYDLKLAVKDSNYFLDTTTPKDTGNAGVVLFKFVKGLVIGRRYRFEVSAWQYITPGKTLARLSLSVAAMAPMVIFEPTAVWGVYGGEFLASSEEMELRLNSLEDSGIGNDYRIDNLRVSGL